MTHLKPAEIVDAAEGAPSARALEHLRDCERCREQVSQATSMLGNLQIDQVPEPSPLFWDHLSRRVRERIEIAPLDPAWEGTARRGWIWAAASAVVAVVVIVVGLAVRGPGRTEHTPVTVASGTSSPADALPTDQQNDPNWEIVAESADGFEWEDAPTAAFVVRPGAAERAALQLSDDQRQELARLLREEIERVKS